MCIEFGGIYAGMDETSSHHQLLLELMDVKQQLNSIMLGSNEPRDASPWFIPSSDRSLHAEGLLRVVHQKSLRALEACRSMTMRELTLQELPHPAEMQRLRTRS